MFKFNKKKDKQQSWMGSGSEPTPEQKQAIHEAIFNIAIPAIKEAIIKGEITPQQMQSTLVNMIKAKDSVGCVKCGDMGVKSLNYDDSKCEKCGTSVFHTMTSLMSNQMHKDGIPKHVIEKVNEGFLRAIKNIDETMGIDRDEV